MTITLAELRGRLEGVKRNGSGWTARCPAHDDRNPSLSIGKGEDGRILVHCHAGCQPDAVVARLGLTMADLGPPGDRPGPDREVEAVYDYVDEGHQLLYQVLRFHGKRFRQRRPDGRDGWLWNLDGTRRVLYRLPEVLAARDEGGAIYVVEGEKDVETLRARGWVATTNPGGAGKWRPEYTDALRDAHVIVVADRDPPGRAHARAVATALTGVARSVKLLEPPPPHKDVTELLQEGGTPEDLVPLPPTEAPRAEGQDHGGERLTGLVRVGAATVQPRTPSYLWYPWLPFGYYVDLAGDPGAGKTFLAIELAARASRGDWPGQPREPVNVVFIAAEDAIETVLRPRLEAAGAQLDRVTFIQGVQGPDGGVVDLALERDLPTLVADFAKHRVGLCYIDALVDVLPTHDGTTYTDSRRATRQVARLARETGAVVLATRHMGKAATAQAWHKSIGSVAYASRARVMLQIYPDPDDPGRRVLTCCKHNLAPIPASLAFRLEGGTEVLPPHVGWLGEDQRGANDLAREAAGLRSAPATARAEDWLQARLASGPVRVGALLGEAVAAGFSRRTLYRAADALGVLKRSETLGAGPGKLAGRRATWALKCQEREGAPGTSSEIKQLANLALDVPTHREMARQASGASVEPPEVVASGALLRLRREASGTVVLESLDGTLVFARLDRGQLLEPGAQEELERAVAAVPARREDLRRILAGLVAREGTRELDP